MKKTGLKEMKRRNREMLIRTILEKGELSRIELAHETQLSPSTVSALVGELLEEGIILTTKLLERAMEKHPQQTYLLILGFVLGSLPELFPGFPVSVPQWLMCLFSLALGGGAIWLLSSQEA